MDTTSAHPPAHAKDSITHHYQSFDDWEPRWFSDDALRSLNAEITKGPFDELQWTLTDDNGIQHASPSLDALLNELSIERVTAFHVEAARFSTTDNKAQFTNLRVMSRGSVVSWQADPGPELERSRLARQRVLDFIDTLPRTKGHSSKFGTAPPPVRSRFRRPPESLREWFAIFAVAIPIVSAILTVFLRLAGVV